MSAGDRSLLLYVRDEDITRQWLRANRLESRCALSTYGAYGSEPHDSVINFIGVGDPQRAASMGASIFGITREYDDLVTRELSAHPDRRYLFLSSGAAYGPTFLEPASRERPSTIAINNLQPQEYYAVAKLHAEAMHRARPELAITDIRVFNYFSRTQDLSARFFITDIVRAIRERTTLRTSPDFMVRDYLHPSDFGQLVDRILESDPRNEAVDCYTKAPVDKQTLLEEMAKNFGLSYEVTEPSVAVNATGQKPNYYSLNRIAEEYGYAPQYSSLDTVLEETRAILGPEFVR